MTLEQAKSEQKATQDQGRRLLQAIPFEQMCSKYGEYIIGGSYKYGLMIPAKPDIDGRIIVKHLDLENAQKLLDEFIRIPEVKKVAIEKNLEGSWGQDEPSIYLQVKVRFEDVLWNLDIHMVLQKDFEHFQYLGDKSFTEEQHDTMLVLKASLKEKGLYPGSTKLPGSFSSYDVYQAVLEYGVSTVEEMVEWGKGRKTMGERFREAQK